MIGLVILLLPQVFINHLILRAKREQRVLFIGFEGGGTFNQIDGNIHLGIHLVLPLLFDFLHLFSMLALLLVEPGVRCKLKPVTLGIQNSQTLGRIDIILH